MSAARLTITRCVHHPAREAVARCVECTRSFCRECIAEHDGRLICATCLARVEAPRQAKRRPWARAILHLAGAVAGVLLAWLSFYTFGRILLLLPSTYHAGFWGDPPARKVD